MNKTLRYTIIWSLVVFAVGVVGWNNGFWLISTARGAAGDLVIDWAGQLTGEPIFMVTDMVPGQMETRTVTVTNNDAVVRTVGVRVSPTASIGGMADVLTVVVKVEGVSVYGDGSVTGLKTLSDFFAESAAPNALTLAEVGPGETIEIEWLVSFGSAIGNGQQSSRIVFDITLGLAGVETQVPLECGGENFNLTGDVIIGTAGSDLLKGTPGNDVIFGLEGSDSIRGYGGDDCLVGGAGSDLIKGGGGNDVLVGGAGSDTLRGDDGDDVLSGGEDSDVLRGGKGNDELNGNEGTDSLYGELGDDYLYGNEGGDSLKGGKGDDVLIGGEGEDVARGEAGTDRCEAEIVKTCEL